MRSADFSIDDDGDLKLDAGVSFVYVTRENLPALLALIEETLNEPEE